MAMAFKSILAISAGRKQSQLSVAGCKTEHRRRRFSTWTCCTTGAGE